MLMMFSEPHQRLLFFAAHPQTGAPCPKPDLKEQESGNSLEALTKVCALGDNGAVRVYQVTRVEIQLGGS